MGFRELNPCDKSQSDNAVFGNSCGLSSDPQKKHKYTVGAKRRNVKLVVYIVTTERYI